MKRGSLEKQLSWKCFKICSRMFASPQHPVYLERSSCLLGSGELEMWYRGVKWLMDGNSATYEDLEGSSSSCLPRRMFAFTGCGKQRAG